MFIEQITLENIRSISDMTVDFSLPQPGHTVRQWSLIVGENGTGKSTILKAAGLLLAGSDSLPYLMGEPSTWVKQGAKAGRIAARLRTQDWELREIQLVIHAGDSPSAVIRRNGAGLEALDAALGHAEQNYFTVGYGPYRRLNSVSAFKRSRDNKPGRAQGLATMFDADTPLLPIQAWAMNMDYRRGIEGLEIVRRSIGTLMPDVLFIGIDKDRETLMFETPDGEIPLERLSDGYQNVAGWIGDLLYRVTDAFGHHKNPLEARGVLLIDEIDAHLHPSWQRRLRAFLSETLPNFQILATTHSALTLQQAHRGEAIVLSRSAEGDVLAQPFPEDPSKLRLHQIYDLGFRISSLDSWEIEKSKDLYRELSARDRSGLSDAEAAELKQAEQVLEVLPRMGTSPDALGNEALEKFFAKLDSTTSALKRRLNES